MEEIILASQSPRRRELLSQVGLKFQVIPSTVEEVITEKDPVKVVQELSRQKAQDVAARLGWAADGPDTDQNPERKIRSQVEGLVIGADTIVVYQGQILGKPKDVQDAVRMLTMLQGHTHSVYTGVTLIFKESGGREKGTLGEDREGSCSVERLTFAEETRVTMYPMTEEEIAWYVETGEPMDKAGAYGIQGICARFIRGISGDYNNVVGLPVGRICQEISRRK